MVLGNRDKKYIERNYETESDWKISRFLDVSLLEVMKYRAENGFLKGQLDIARFVKTGRILAFGGLALALATSGYFVFDRFYKKEKDYALTYSPDLKDILSEEDVRVGKPMKLEDIADYVKNFSSEFGTIKESYFAENQKGFVFLIPQTHPAGTSPEELLGIGMPLEIKSLICQKYTTGLFNQWTKSTMIFV